MNDQPKEDDMINNEERDWSAESVTLFSSGLLSKWGFSDGDVLDDIAFDMRHAGVLSEDVTDDDLLYRAVETHLLPKLTQSIKLERISTIHNSTRAALVDGQDVTDRWYDSFEQHEGIVDDVGVRVNGAEILALAREIVAERI